MTDSSADLSPFQRELLEAFFAREAEFYLTGGGALVGFHLHHRHTDDLDLFAPTEEAFQRGGLVVAEVARQLGASMVIRQDAPGFKRLVVSRGDEAVVVDLVYEPVTQEHPDLRLGGIRVDVPAEILINKLTTIVSRAEERDLVDVLFLERAGLRVEDALAAALRKDGGCTAATLAWVLSQVDIPDGASLPGGVSPVELREFVGSLVRRLRAAAFPGDHCPAPNS